MRVFDMTFEIKHQEDGSEYLNCPRTNPQDFSQENYQEGIVILREKWFNFDIIDHRKTFEFI